MTSKNNAATSASSVTQNQSLKVTLVSNYSLATLLSLDTKEEGIYLRKKVEDNPKLVTHQYFGGEENNAGNIRLNALPEASVGERITNGCDAKIEEAIYKGLAAQYENPFEIGSAIFKADKKNLPVASRPVHLKLRGNYNKDAESTTLDVRDYGIGIPADRMLDTILNSKSGTKSNDGRFIGRYGHGGSTTFSFSKFSMVASRHIDSDKVGVAFVKYCAPGDRNPITGKEQRRSGTFLTLLDPNTGKPFVFPAYDSNGDEVFKPGTHIRHFEYEMDPRDLNFYSNPTTRKSSLFKTMQTMFPNPPIPFAIFDERLGAPGNQLHATVYGSFRSLNNNVSNKVEYSNSATVNVGEGSVKLHWFVLNGEATRKQYINNFVNYGYSGNIFLSGQTIEKLPAQIIRDSGLPFLEKGIVIFADLDQLDDRTKDDVMTATREALKTKYRNMIHAHLVTHLQRDPKVQEIHEDRKSSLVSTPSNQNTVSQLKKYFKDYYTGSSGNGKGGNKGGGTKPTTSPDPIPVENTFIDVSAPNRALYANQSFSVGFRTDIDNDLFKKPSFEVTSQKGLIVTTNWSISDDRNGIQGHKTLAGLQVDKEVEINDRDVLSLKVTLPSGQVIEDTVSCLIAEKPDSRKKKGNKKGVPNFDVKWIDKSQKDLLSSLCLTDNEDNPIEDKVGHIVRDSEGSITVYLNTFNTEVASSLEAISNHGTAKQRYDHYKDFFLEGYFDFQVSVAASAFLLEDEGNVETPSPRDEDDTDLEKVMKSAARSASAYWKMNFMKLAN